MKVGQGGESVFLCLSMVVQNIVSFSSMCSFHSEIILCELDFMLLKIWMHKRFCGRNGTTFFRWIGLAAGKLLPCVAWCSPILKNDEDDSTNINNRTITTFHDSTFKFEISKTKRFLWDLTLTTSWRLVRSLNPYFITSVGQTATFKMLVTWMEFGSSLFVLSRYEQTCFHAALGVCKGPRLAIIILSFIRV